METTSNEISDRISKHLNNEEQIDSRYKKYGLGFNPFPKSGTANINSSSFYTAQLTPSDDEVQYQIEEYILASLFAKGPDEKDKYLGTTIIGDYGSGKTQLLLYVKTFLEKIALDKKHHKNPFVIYIDNPGVNLHELIGSIISTVGEENFKKYVWNNVIEKIILNHKADLLSKFPVNTSMFEDMSPFADSSLANYKQFINAYHKTFNNSSKKVKFDNLLKETILTILNGEFGDSAVAEYFYNILIQDLGYNTAWDSLVKGAAKKLEKKEVHIIRAVIKVLNEQGFSDVFILVDEFEDITRGRLNKAQVDSYLTSLRTLIDKERNWTILFAMTAEAFESLQTASPPLAARISTRKILLKGLTLKELEKIVNNYLRLARLDYAETGSIEPFTKEALELLMKNYDQNARLVLSSCFKLLEKLLDTDSPNQLITESFVKQNLLMSETN